MIDKTEATKDYKDGEVIFRENSLAKEIYIIMSGKVEISREIDGRKMSIAVFETGDFFGEMAPITHRLRSATATAIGSVSLKSLSVEAMVQQMHADRNFMVSVVERLIRRLRITTEDLGAQDAKLYELKSKLYRGEYEEITQTEHSHLNSLVSDLRRMVDQRDKQIKDLDYQHRRSKRQLEYQKRLLEYHQMPWYRKLFAKKLESVSFEQTENELKEKADGMSEEE